MKEKTGVKMIKKKGGKFEKNKSIKFYEKKGNDNSYSWKSKGNCLDESYLL